MSETKNPLAQLNDHGQSPWLDFVSRSLLESGELVKLIERDGVRGVTSNPSIFEKAIGQSTEYDPQLKETLDRGDLDISTLYETLAITDISHAADQLYPVWEQTKGQDGYISLEVSPYLALRTQDTIDEARRLWQTVDKPNLMIKVPGTEAGVPAIETLIADGININVTLLFSLKAYDAVAWAYIKGLEARVAKGEDISHIASVASFFVSRIDASVEKEVERKLKAGEGDADVLRSLQGKVAIANAKMAYQHYKKLIADPRWKALEAKGAHPQRLLWASTGVKSKDLPDTLYVETLIGANTVNTMPPATMDATRDHGKIATTIEDDLEAAQKTLHDLAAQGISLDQITTDLVVDGVQRFADDADKLYGAVAQRRAQFFDGEATRSVISFGSDALKKDVETETETWRHDGLIRALWRGEKTLWTNADEDKWIGWLHIVEQELADAATLTRFAQHVQEGGYTDVVLLGMGGSSLGPEVLSKTFGQRSGWPIFHMLDSTDPAQVKAIRDAVALPTTLFIVSSKSGSTLEPNIFKQYFYEAAGKNGRHFVAVTDPGSHMEEVARQDGFADIFHGVKSIGGRYSVLSKFGLVPAAAIGIDVPAFLSKTLEMVHACGPYAPPAQNPGLQLGLALGVAATKYKRDKVTLIASPGIADIGAWLEQLLAESTGKQGKGLIPVADEPRLDPTAYGNDRFFAYIALKDGEDAEQAAFVAALEKAGHPVARLTVPSTLHIGQEFFRWEIATAVAGAILDINPFDQPDVEASKIKTRELTASVEKTGSLPEEKPFFTGEGIALYADPRNAAAFGTPTSLAAALKIHFDRIGSGDYAALLAYIERTEAHEAAMQDIRAQILNAKHVATCLGFGPRFLHSTGQAYKGGPNSGVFLQITTEDAQDQPVPGQSYGFSIVKAAQARGDFDVLAERGRRALRVHFTSGVESGLTTLADAVRQALS
ncbi:bifunctional transaldolase/phosoglucose isomerase [Granulibacter bethesdensis]|uniref:Transaldolase n=1 Tax=Granulibacter bethesdensis (strain ATCC BAA-1260 / CGDNIH1) TaxID=391165 RepID=Q0BTU9_GRABC|nr:bifunctional transaldolase/phosoglucose isomerase [Granulibacter bethesdensis]ABI61753.1 Glucose-6-phosphate isomerase [Granulibacter bethesdensis CGDNIH1]APH51562.1 Glucose-6-phosphate isomerase [Granulibacter bethesdensis]APH64255.1 Glucose-6-phosphate isomerase [Granulibacter bethesdensis]